MNDRLISTIEPWYRHRWPWFLMLGPFTVVVAAAVTIYLAIVSNDGLVDDDYYKQGLAINQITARDQFAATRGLQADLMLGADRVRVLLTAGDSQALPESLVLHLTHPTRAGVDQTIVLASEQGAAGLYSGRIAVVPQGRWHVVLEDSKKEWRLTGEWVAEGNATLKLVSEPSRNGG
jgi:uncharacterized protein